MRIFSLLLKSFKNRLPWSTDRMRFGLTRPETWLVNSVLGCNIDKLTWCKSKSKNFHFPSLIFWKMKSSLTLSVFVINENHCNYKRSILRFIRHLWNQKDHLSSNYPCDQNCLFDNLKRHSYNLGFRHYKYGFSKTASKLYNFKDIHFYALVKNPTLKYIIWISPLSIAFDTSY